MYKHKPTDQVKYNLYYFVKFLFGGEVKRAFTMVLDKIKCGFTEPESWDLCTIIGQFILAGLKSFRKYNVNNHPRGVKNMEEWYQIQDDMIFAFEMFLKNYDGYDSYLQRDTEFFERVDRGFRYFGKYFRDLWD